MTILDQSIETVLDIHADSVAKYFEADVFSFAGPIIPEYLSGFLTNIESLATNDAKPKSPNLVFILYTRGGIVETVENIVDIIRQYYTEVWFVVPNMAMSAGTILCMSGDKIYMDYSSALGPIDPQIATNDGQLVPALGYLDRFERMIKKSSRGKLTDAEYAILLDQDLAALDKYEQARELSISLLEDWLVRYKFKNWHNHSSNGKPVTTKEKQIRAREIAQALSDHKKWHSHARKIGIKTLKDLNLKIEDYTNNDELRYAIRCYSELVLNCIQNWNLDHMFHTYNFSED